jgi:hypothetical protein
MIMMMFRLCAPLMLLTLNNSFGLIIDGVNIPHARVSSASRAIERPAYQYPPAWPYSSSDLIPEDTFDDQLFYVLPKFGHHAGDECRSSLTKYYEAILPVGPAGSVLDLCSSWTSHYPASWTAGRCVAIGLNPLELIANPSKTEWRCQNLNTNTNLPYGNEEFDLVTNSLSVDYMTQPRELFREIHRVLKPGGICAIAFTNRCFPSKIVPIWARPFTDVHHVRIVANYFHFSAEWKSVDVIDVSPAGWVGERDPMYIVQGRK